MYKQLRTFGCEAYAHVPKDLRAKLDLKSKKCIFVGYGLNVHFGYRLWDPENSCIVRSSDVVFHETKMHKQPQTASEGNRVPKGDIP